MDISLAAILNPQKVRGWLFVSGRARGAFGPTLVLPLVTLWAEIALWEGGQEPPGPTERRIGSWKAKYPAQQS